VPKKQEEPKDESAVELDYDEEEVIISNIYFESLFSLRSQSKHLPLKRSRKKKSHK
jgi:hypothetical protein